MISSFSTLKSQLTSKAIAVYRLIFARPKLQPVNKFLFRLSLSGMGILNYENDQVTGEAAFLERFAAGYENPVVFDVGANIGKYSDKILQYAPYARIYAFEPHPVIYRQLERRISAPNFEAFNLACGSDEASLTLYDYADRDGSAHASLHRGVLENLHNAESMSEHEVDVIRLEDFIENRAVHQVDLLKIDTEGNELDVLRGVESLIDAGRIGCIHFEFNEMNVESGVFFKQIADFLPEFDFFRMLPDGLMPLGSYNPLTWEIYAFQNIVALHRSKSDLAQ